MEISFRSKSYIAVNAALGVANFIMHPVRNEWLTLFAFGILCGMGIGKSSYRLIVGYLHPDVNQNVDAAKEVATWLPGPITTIIQCIALAILIKPLKSEWEMFFTFLSPGLIGSGIGLLDSWRTLTTERDENIAGFVENLVV